MNGCFLGPPARKLAKSSSFGSSKWSSIARLFALPIMMISLMPASTNSSTTYWIIGLSISGNISFGMALVCGKNRVPKPAAAMIALVGFLIFQLLFPIISAILKSFANQFLRKAWISLTLRLLHNLTNQIANSLIFSSLDVCN